LRTETSHWANLYINTPIAEIFGLPGTFSGFWQLRFLGKDGWVVLKALKIRKNHRKIQAQLKLKDLKLDLL